MQVLVRCSVKLDGGRVKFNVEQGDAAPQVVLLNVGPHHYAAFKIGETYKLIIEPVTEVAE